MKKPKDDGGLAFPGKRWEHVDGPCGEKDVVEAEHPGMSMRDYVAIKAMAALIQKYTWPSPSHAVESAYSYADAVIKERAK